MKPSNVSEPLRPGYGNDILPFFVSLQEFMGEPPDLTIHSSMLEDIPHQKVEIYYLWYVNKVQEIEEAPAARR